MRFKLNTLLQYIKSTDQLIRAQAAIKKIAVKLVVGISVVAFHTLAVAAPGITGTVTRVIDGDTIWVQTAAYSKPLKVRIRSVDAPEICQDGGLAAKNALKGRVLGKAVVLFTKAIDNFDRTVAKVDFQGEDLGRWMVAGGHAWSLGAFDSAGPYKSEQLNAQRNRRGLFSQAISEHPKDFRKRHGSCYLRR